MADLEYMKFTFIDKDNLNRDDNKEVDDKLDLFDYIDSIG